MKSYCQIALNGTILGFCRKAAKTLSQQSLTPSDITLDVEPPIQIAAPARFFSDLGIRFQDRVRYVEVVGACGADRVTRNDWEAHLLAQFDRRLEVYRQQRLTPQIWYLNDLLEPAQLQKRFLALVAQLRAGGRS
ncbi:hypothetical protein [Brytella acorum]|uniref:Uncharacterized protein n=1 Tax=Brytella acorum TaxID=2959299 RepID=A0AA35XYN5_9PROT|nr:hypothetical protein [Brytella acorum]CAI9121527.1 hypothetical protein LMG32879_002374 [Brytella acorum]